MNTLTIDIETIPDQRHGAIDEFLQSAIEDFKAPSTLSKEQAATELNIAKDSQAYKDHSKESMIAAWCEEFAERKSEAIADEAWRKTALSGSRGEIAVIGYKWNDEPAQAIWRDDPSPQGEVDVLQAFFGQARDFMRNCGGDFAPIVKIGHNIEAFDLLFTWQRSVIRQVKPSFDIKPRRYSDSMFDTMTQWAGYGNRISLDALCKALGIESPKQGIDGSMIYDCILQGRMLEVVDYCKADVEATYRCWQMMNFNDATVGNMFESDLA